MVSTVPAAGTSLLLDLAAGNVFDVTLDQATCALTLAGALNGYACSATVYLRQGTGGSKAVTWPASVAWPYGNEPLLATAAGALDVITLVTLDGGTTWAGFHSTTVPAEADPGGQWINGGVETMRRLDKNASSLVTSSGRVNLTYFTCCRTQTITKIAIQCGGTAVAATPTLVRFGFYQVAANGDLTRACATGNVASSGCTEYDNSGTVTASNVRYGGTTFREYQAPLAGDLGLPTSYTFIAGRRYAGSQIQVSGATLGAYYGNNAGSPDLRHPPRMAGSRDSQTDLPASITAAQVLGTNACIYMVGLA